MKIDTDQCIKILQNKNEDLGLREDAADGLMWIPSQKASEAIFNVLMDESEDEDLRFEMASCLGSIWREIGIDEEKISKLAEIYKNEVMREYNLISNNKV